MDEKLQAAEAAETGACDSCEVVMIQGVRCHEHGCPRYLSLHRLRVAAMNYE